MLQYMFIIGTGISIFIGEFKKSKLCFRKYDYPKLRLIISLLCADFKIKIKFSQFSRCTSKIGHKEEKNHFVQLMNRVLSYTFYVDVLFLRYIIRSCKNEQKSIS